MKIGVLSNLYPPHALGGYERLCADVSLGLEKRGHEVVVLASDFRVPKPSGESRQSVDRDLQLIANYENLYNPLSISNDDRQSILNKNRRALDAFIEKNRPDILFVWNLFFLGESLVKGVSYSGIPVVYFLTDNWLIADAHGERIGEFFTRFVHGAEMFNPESTRSWSSDPVRAEYAIFGSRFVQNLYGYCGINFSNQAIIHNGVNIPMVSEELRIDRRRYRSKNGLKLLFAGRVVDVKGLHMLVEALPKIIADAPAGAPVSLSIVGDRHDRQYVERIVSRIDQLGLANHVQFRDPVSEESLISLFNDHDIFVFPSVYEPFSLTLIHALAAGIPTVATDIGGNAEIVHDRETGLLFDNGDIAGLAAAVVALSRDAAMRVHVSEKGRRAAARFTFDRMIRRIERQLAAYLPAAANAGR